MSSRKKDQEKKLIVTYTKSAIGYNQRQRGTLRALGLRRLGDVAEHRDTDVIRGMVDKVSHLVQVEEQLS
ncbi:MAG: 50S ribosomal protein L30 [Caldilineales bacterium]|nr:50S ribosomal protein L30 [Caldilineales bacterium]